MYLDRVEILEDLLIHPSSSSSAVENRDKVKEELFDAILDLCEARVDAFADEIAKLEVVLDDKRRTTHRAA